MANAPVILLLVPDLFFQARLETAARRMGFRVVKASDGTSALSKIRDQRPSACVVDLGASEAAGPMRFLAALRDDPALAGLPTLGFLSHVRDDLAKAAREAGCGRILAKSALSEDSAGILADLVATNPASDSPFPAG